MGTIMPKLHAIVNKCDESQAKVTFETKFPMTYLGEAFSCARRARPYLARYLYVCLLLKRRRLGREIE